MQALGPVALVSLLLNTGLIKAVPGSDINENPNLPEDPELQERYNRAAVQVAPLLLSSHTCWEITSVPCCAQVMCRPQEQVSAEGCMQGRWTRATNLCMPDLYAYWARRVALNCAGDDTSGHPLLGVGGTAVGISVQHAVKAHHFSIPDSRRHHHQHLAGDFLLVAP